MTAQLDISEKAWQSQVLDLARIFGWTVAHFRPAQTSKGWRTPVAADGAGFPDLLLVRDRVLYVELKAAKGNVGDALESGALLARRQWQWQLAW